ncbi:MAG: glutamate--tRNA ligase [Treponema sp.]|jgi:glutamyl-tRNA synthetase|nr:glutamate--tRNA ligase [Treponema sp.]
MQIRDRYAPSPTGLQHIGGVRTALFNYLFARSKNGSFILRLEDTDRTRFDQSFVQNLYDTFSWLGFRWDEGPDTGGRAGPYIQSERFALYREYAQKLIDAGKAYYCFCSAERIDRVRREREEASSKGISRETGYDRFCRSIPAPEAAARVAAGEAHTIRLKIPLGESTRFHDELLGDIEWKNEDINSDPVLLKSDGFPTYHLANVVDDHLMEISHVLRAQEWLPSTPLHVIMYHSFGWAPPVYCHLPMVMGQDGKKLSKRHGAASIDEFRCQGFLSEALINYIALLGASYEEGKDIYSLDELAARFSLEKLNKAPAVFDYKKLEWYNAYYLRRKSDEDLAALMLPYAVDAGLFAAPGTAPDTGQKAVFTAAMPLIRERINFPGEGPDKLRYLFSDPPLPAKEEFFPRKADLSCTVELLHSGKACAESLALAPNDESAEAFVKAFAGQNGLKLGDLLMPLRVAITGSRVSPPLFGSLRLLGPEKSLFRIDRALTYLESGRAAD